MKRAFVGLLIVAVFLMGWRLLRDTARIPLDMLSGRTVKLARGDLTIPIEASGTIEPRDRSEIKSEAGGTVLATPFEVGEMVASGDVLVTLDPEDEQRQADRAETAVEQSRINVQVAEATLAQRRHEIPATEARIAQIEADLDYWKWKDERWSELTDTGSAHQDERRSIASNLAKFEAQLKQSEAQLAQAGELVRLADLDVARARLAQQQAETELADARERLKETTITAPADGMLLQLLVKKGAVIVSGSRSLTGGTPLAVLAAVDQLYVRALVDEADIGRVYDIAPLQARPGSPRHLENASGDVAPTEANAGQAIPIVPGTPVTVTVEAFPEDTFHGVIDLIEPEPARRGAIEVVTTYVVRIRLTDDDVGKLFLGMQATVQFVSESRENVLLVPNDAVRILGGQRGVYVPIPSSTDPTKRDKKFVPFKAGLDDGMHTEVLSGLEDGQEVYTQLPRTFGNGDG